MKFEADFMQRAYHANLLRIRASRQRELAADRSMSSTRQELEAEALWCDAEAKRLDDADEPMIVSDKVPSRVDARRDIDAVDAPGQREAV